MSWHEDFTRNFSRIFSRSKSASVDRSESEDDDATTVTSSSHTPAQELQFSDLLDRSSESPEQDVTWGAAGRSELEIPPLFTPVPQPSPAAPPVDGFFKRLGSLFFFSQAEAVEVQIDRQTDTDCSRPITRDSESDAEAQKTGGSVEVSVCHSEVTHTQSEENSDGHCNAVDINSTKKLLEEKSRYDLACPPVVTYGTYRGLRQVRRQKKKSRMELHSPVSEGEEGTHPDRYEHIQISTTSNTMSYGCLENPTSVNPCICHTSRESDLTLSATDTETRDGDSAIRLPHIAVRDPDPSVICIGHSLHRIHKLEPDPLNLPSNSGKKQIGTLKMLSADPQMSCRRVQGDSEEKLVHVDSGKDEEVLRLESVKMVDNILVNAFVALERMEVPDPGNDILATGELTEDSEPTVFEGASVGSDVEQQFSVMLSDQTPSSGLEEAQAAGRSHAEGCRSTPSSGYESIAGSDTDIRFCLAVASDITATNVPISSEHKEHDANQTLLEHFAEEREINRKAACKSSAADEMLSVNLHILPKTNSRSEQPPVNVSVPKTEPDGERNKSQDTAKDYTMSDNCRHSLNSDSCYVCTIDTVISVNHESQSRTEPFNHSFAPDKEDSEKSDTPKISEILGRFPSTQSHKSVERKAPQSGITVDESVVQSADEHVCSGGNDSSQWTSVKAFCCNVTDDQSPGILKDDLDTREEETTSAASSACRRNQFDFPGRSSSCSASVSQHSRLLELDLVRVDGSCAIISEEEEMDGMFVNDMGPMHSPTTHRGKMYPFSLSPIYEEESVSEEASGNEMPQVPPAIEEEQRSVEQPALSVLSLLQSVSEKLQSSIKSASDDRHTVCLGSVPRPLWDRFREDREEEDEDISSVLQHQQLTETKTVNEPNTGDEFCSHIDRISGEAQDRLQECDGMAGNVEKNATLPVYQYLTNSLMPSAEMEPKEDKHCSAGCQSERNTTVMGELGGFGKFSPRPSIIFIYEGETLCGERRAIYDDVEDTEKAMGSHGATVHAVKGCWLLYVDSWFRGPCVLLEEGQTVRISEETQQNLKELREPNRTGMKSVGSIRTLLKDDSVPEMHLHVNMSQMSDKLRLFAATDLTEQHGTVLLSDLCVKTGCWLVYDKPGFSGNSAVLEAEGSVTSLFQNSLVLRVKSLRPLKRGGLKVMRPLDPKVILYEKQQFQGQYRELLDHTGSLMTTDGPLSISSIRVLGGTWVCFSEEGFRGHQYVLEEGQYSNCTQLFSHTEDTIKSLRYIQSDFWEPAVCLKRSDEEFNLMHADVPDMRLNGPSDEADSIHVMRGTWVAYSERGFTGDQYVLEKGRYPGALEWGSGAKPPRSLRPIRREVCGIVEPAFSLRAYTQTHYAGESREFVGEALDCSVPGLVSFRVIRGSWLLFDEEGYSGNQYILGEGLYPDLTSCGCVSTAIRSLKPIPYSFTDLSISLFSLSGFEGLEETLFSDMENMSKFFSQSLRVNSGLWVAYEYSQFNGRQMLLEPGKYSDWKEHSGWDTIGSLKSLRQPKVHIQVRNRALGSVVTTENFSEGSFPAKAFLSPADGSLSTQRWIFTDGLLKNTMRGGCLSVIGAKACVGARVALWEEHGRMNQRWSLNEDGRISSHLNRSLVLDLKGGNDRVPLILSQLCVNKSTQMWDMDVL